jgi:4-diphosphocytidyl-2-C-methyl-D-erythritol kinase
VNNPDFTLPSFAKINLGLRILGKRPDGYHEIRTVLQTISLHDTLQFKATSDNDILLSCDETGIPCDQRNLIVRAAYNLRDRYGVNGGARIHLEKRIPVQGGLGGGSSNAAVTLFGLADLWTLKKDIDELTEVASGLGADVPFFLHGGRASASGIGTKILPLPDCESVHVVVISPRATVSTEEAYKALNSPALTTSNSESILSISRSEANLANSDLRYVHNHLENDFERVIFDIEPEIERAKRVLLQAGAVSALLAGSGSSVFGIFENQEAQQRAVYEVSVERSWQVFSCVTLSRDEYLRALVPAGDRSSSNYLETQ